MAVRSESPSPAGAFIALEGWEASGKSTQARLLAERLDAVLTREPGGTELGVAIRGLLLDNGPVPCDRAEALLFAADRAQHVAEVVRPATEAGRHVVTDRSFGSTLAYQAYGRRQPLDEILELSIWASADLLPQLVVLIEVPAVEADRRLGSERDRLESESDQFGERVREGFRHLAADDPDRWRVVDGTGSVEDVHARVVETVDRWLADRSTAGVVS